MLSEDQIKAVKELKSWWYSGSAYHVLDGSAGTGKSFVVDTIIKEFPRAVPLLLAPTHKALRQLREKTKGSYEFRTVASSLGLRPVDEGKALAFEQIALPSIWDKVNVAIIDEAGLLDEYQLNLLRSIGMKILFVGHKAQLPPVILNRSMFDLCESPVFEQGYGQSHLWIPKRNTGELWDFNNALENNVYVSSMASKTRSRPTNLVTDTRFDISDKNLNGYFKTSEALKEIKDGIVKIALWTNEGVNNYNNKIRKLVFGEGKELYGKDDLVITTNSVISFDGMEFMNDNQILRHSKDGLDIYTDTDGRVQNVKRVVVQLNKHLKVECYKFYLLTELEGLVTLYSLVNHRDYKSIADYYEHIAWSRDTKQAKDKAYRDRATILKCFAQVKHFYAATSHRLQGSSIPKVIVIQSDINKNSNIVEKAKLTYVACSRASKELMIYRGI